MHAAPSDGPGSGRAPQTEAARRASDAFAVFLRVLGIVTVTTALIGAVSANCCRPGSTWTPRLPADSGGGSRTGRAAAARTVGDCPAASTELTLSFADLSGFDYDPPATRDGGGEAWPDFVPRRVYELSGRRVSIVGYVVPIDFQDERFTRFILASFLPSCCFADSIRPNQWIEVEMKDRTKVAFRRGLNRVSGVLEVVPHDSPLAASELYRMTAESVEGTE